MAAPAPVERGVEDLIAEHLLANLEIITEAELVRCTLQNLSLSAHRFSNTRIQHC